MDIRLDSPLSPAEGVGSLEPSHLWILGLAADERVPRRSAPRVTSPVVECECPGACLLDHENE